MSQDGEQHISLRTYVYNEDLPLPIVIRKPIKPRPIDSDESGEELEDIYPAPICISCSGVDNDPLVWCSGCADPYHTDVSSIQTQPEIYPKNLVCTWLSKIRNWKSLSMALSILSSNMCFMFRFDINSNSNIQMQIVLAYYSSKMC